tara:strand:+ start:2224 stop:2517 length:294 start_codon:yes stop_codon:yes gene_type:complete
MKDILEMQTWVFMLKVKAWMKSWFKNTVLAIKIAMSNVKRILPDGKLFTDLLCIAVKFVVALFVLLLLCLSHSCLCRFSNENVVKTYNKKCSLLLRL